MRPNFKNLKAAFADVVQHGDVSEYDLKRLALVLAAAETGDVDDVKLIDAGIFEPARSARGLNRHEALDIALAFADKILGGHGTEPILANRNIDNYRLNTVAVYVNMGDTYTTTVLLDTERGKFYLTSYGDWIEAMERSRRYRFE